MIVVWQEAPGLTIAYEMTGDAESTAGGAHPRGSVSLEHDLISSDMRIEAALLAFRENPSRVPELLGVRQPGAALPFDPGSLRYDVRAVESVARRRAAGEDVPIRSALPAAWRDAILAHLGLLDGATQTPAPAAAASEPAQRRGSIANWMKALRLHQWSKNSLVFVPLIMSHQLLLAEPLVNTIMAFVCFGLVASSIYLMNDLMDLRQDRRHATKRRRPFASGALAVSHGLAAIPFLMASAVVVASQLPPAFWLVMGAYVALNLGYTFYLKRKLLVDVIALSGAYTLRILAGNAAGPVELSNWLLAFSMFLFLSLALVKRYVELDTAEAEAPDEKRVMGRGYRKGDLDMISQLGVASGFSAVVVLALFVEGAGKSGLYTHRELIWLVCPIILYVVSRIWVLAKRRELPDDPIFFILTDWRSHLMGAIVAMIFYFAI
jgi:4-hydroxybenzoate polyprenyltransferase